LGGRAGVIPVCLVSYILPIIIHLFMFCRPGGRAEQLGGLKWLQRLFPSPSSARPEGHPGQPGSDSHAPLLEVHHQEEKVDLPVDNTHVTHVFFWREIVRELMVPIGVALVGLSFSIGALWVALQGAISGRR
jgi:hypothetical protein